MGGGQLGRMFAQAAQSMGYHVAVLEPAADFSTLENVLIIRGGRDVPTEDEITNAEQDAASASPDASSTATKTGKTDPTPTPDSKGGEGDQ